MKITSDHYKCQLIMSAFAISVFYCIYDYIYMYNVYVRH